MLLALTCKMMYEISEEGWRDSFAKDFKERADIAAQHVSEGEARAAGLLKRAAGAERAEVTDATSSGANVTNKIHGAVFIDPVMQDVSTRVFPECTQAALAEEVTFIHTVKELRHKIDTNAMLTVNTAMRRVVVSFRGTASAQNVLSDAKVLKRGADDHSGTSGPAIHGGFAEAYYRGGVAVELESRLAELYRDRGDLFDQRLYITGHSLGGALAQLLAYRLVRHSMLPDKVKVYVVTFGSPRLGGPTFAAALDGMPQVVNYRVVNNKDPVPRVPLFHFRHAGILLQLRSSATPGVAGEAQVYPSGGVAPPCANCVCANTRGGHHSIARYKPPQAPKTAAQKRASAGPSPSFAALNYCAFGGTPADAELGDESALGAGGGGDCWEGQKEHVVGSQHAYEPNSDAMNAGPECFSGYFYSLASVPDDEWPAAGEPWCGVTATDFIKAPASYSGAFFVNDVAIAEPAAESEATEAAEENGLKDSSNELAGPVYARRRTLTWGLGEVADVVAQPQSEPGGSQADA
jgi:hypothetical protein